MAFVQPILQALSHLIAPRVCRVCGQSLTSDEKYLCLGCYLDIPRCDVHRDDFNDIHRRLGHRVAVDRAAGWFYYKRQSPYAALLVDAKYRSLPALAEYLGARCAEELAADAFFDGIDALVPMPMFWWKRLRRGYNQSVEICRGISSVTGIPIIEAVRAAKSHGVQSRHSRQQRYTSISGTLAPSSGIDLAGKHVLLVDDILTTGASMQEALAALALTSPAAISVLCIGLTKQQM